jgi:hypothetical protein
LTDNEKPKAEESKGHELSKDTEKNQLVTFRVPLPLLEAFDNKHSGVDRAESLRQLMTVDVKQPGATVTFNYEARKAERIRLKKEESTLAKLLRTEECPDGYRRKDAYEFLILDFGVQCGAGPCLEKNLDKVLEQLKITDCFTNSTRESAIDYVEAVLARRRVEAELKVYRQSTANT